MTTCIDTVEIYYPLSQYEARYVSYQLDALTHATDDGHRTRFLSTDPSDEDSNVLVYERFYPDKAGEDTTKMDHKAGNLQLQNLLLAETRTSHHWKVLVATAPL